MQIKYLNLIIYRDNGFAQKFIEIYAGCILQI